MLSYADLVTLLLGFFLILYASSQIDIVKFEALSLAFADAFNAGVSEGVRDGSAIFDGGTGIIPGDGSRTDPTDSFPSAIDVIRSAVAERAQARGVIAAQILVTEDADANVVIRLADHLLFPSASAAIRSAALPLLDVVADVVVSLPNEIRVEGHTDNVPVGTAQYPTNWELSSARATAVLRYLVEEGGIAPGQLFAAGYGEFRPVGSNRTPEGRALNRRADIVVLQPESAPAGPITWPFQTGVGAE